MSGFVDRPGVPLIDAAIKCTGDRALASIQQQTSPAAPPGGEGKKQAWSIPVCVRPPGGRTTCDVIDASATEVPLSSCPDWVVANAGARGYYRVAYPPAMLRRLAADVKTLAPTERIALLADEWELVRSGRHDIDSFMDLASGFKGERNAAVVATLVSSLKTIADDLTTPASRPAYDAWVASLLGPALEALGWRSGSSENDDTRALRASLVLGLGTAANDPDVIAKARSLVLEELAKPGTVEPTLLNAAVTVAAKHGDRALYEKFRERSTAASDPEEHYRYMYALASFDDPALVRRTMAYLAGPDVRSQDTKVFLAALLANPDARKQSWPLLRSRWAEVQKKTGNMVYGGNGLVITALGTFCDSRTRTEVARFFATHTVPDAVRTLQQSLERIGQCSAMAATEPARLSAWLTQKTSPSQGSGASR
jgi:aminopeptidase N